ncbi:MAG TPA: FKBP-type peptidyl-prolyl cis-trans isomerase [Candidatus Paceibacterota bacterium]
MTSEPTLGNYLSVIMTILATAGIVVLLIYGYAYFSSAKKDIVANDIKIEIKKQGTGIGAKLGDEVLVNYIGTLSDGSEFDNSYKRGKPFPVTIGEGQVIQGWEEGLLGIKIGEKRKLTIPPAMGYGDRAVPDGRGGFAIPPNSTLIFEIEALEIYSRA